MCCCQMKTFTCDQTDVLSDVSVASFVDTLGMVYVSVVNKFKMYLLYLAALQ